MKNAHPQSIFQTDDDRTCWDKYAEQLPLIGLSESEYHRALKAVRFLRSFLGEKFLKRAARHNHPLYYELRNSAPIARLRLIRFVESIWAIESAPGFESLAKRLKDARKPDGFREASSVLEPARSFSERGFTIILDPSAEVLLSSGEKRFKVPDLKLIDRKTCEEIIVEVSRLHQSQEDIEDAHVFNSIFFIVQHLMDDSLIIKVDHTNNRQVHEHLLPCVNILPGLTSKELPRVIKQLQELASDVKSTNRFHQLRIKNKVEIGTSPVGDHSKAEAWMKERGMRDTVESPPLRSDEIRRIRRKISDKTQQLPSDKPGIIFVSVNETLALFTHGIRAILDGVSKDLEKFPQLFCVVLCSDAVERELIEPIIYPIDGHLFIKQTRHDWITEQKLVIANPGFELSMSESTGRQIWQALM